MSTGSSGHTGYGGETVSNCSGRGARGDELKNPKPKT